MVAAEEERLAFAEELEEVALQLATQYPSEPSEQRTRQVREEYERLAVAAEMFALPDVATLISWVKSSLDSDQANDLLESGKYFSWLEITALIFREPEEISHLPMLLAELNDPVWPNALSGEQLQSFLLSLRPEADLTGNAVGGTKDAAGDPVDSDENPLSFARDVHPELMGAYMQEAPEQVSEAARLIRLIATGSDSREQRQQAARLAHTLKGSSSVVGLEPIVSFTHRLEDLLDMPLKEIPRPLSVTLEASADCLESLFDYLQSGMGLPEEYPGLLQDLSDWVDRLRDEHNDGQGQALPDLQQLTELPDFLRDIYDVEEGEPQPQETDGVVEKPTQIATSNEVRIQSMLRLARELITSTSQTAGILQQARTLGKQLYQQDEQIRQRLDELDSLVDQQRRHGASEPGQKTGYNIRVVCTGLPESGAHTMDQPEIESYSDLYSTTSLLTEAAADSRELAQQLQGSIRKLSDELYQQQQRQRQLSEAILGLRLAPVSNLVPRLERIVRETCRKTGKQAELIVTGQDLQVDADILRGLTDPLLHLLRNAVDHGIETPQQRQTLGKPEQGVIRLYFSRSGNQVRLVVEDDGAGMDIGRIHNRAVQRGLIHTKQELDDQAVMRLVLLPGFSTRDEVSEVSGRGVGMDVVRSSIEQLRGTLQLENQPGQGMQITINLPQTLVATHALVVRVGGHLLAIPADNVEQLLYVTAGENIIDEQGWRIETERYQLPVIKLADILHWNSPAPEAGQSHTLLLVRSEQALYALHAEEILPSRDLVVNSLAPWLNHIHSVQGASILADGSVAPVLDVARLLYELENGTLQLRESQKEFLPEHTAPVIVVLVVDDSLSNRKSMRLLLEGMGYLIHTAVDGLDALKLMGDVNVDIVLTDLEMPRMNGLELTQAIRIWPEKTHIPVVMLTSRSTQRHRELAVQAGVDSYMTKPVQETALKQEVQKWHDTQMKVTGSNND